MPSLSRNTRAALASLAVATLGLVGCRHQAKSPSVALRIVSISPSTTEAIVAIGAREALVGRSRYCDFPPEIQSLPEVGGFVDPNFEAIVALRPDLVTGARGPAGAAMADRLRSLGIETYFPETESLTEIDAMIVGLGARTVHEASARQIVIEIHARETATKNAVLAFPRTRTLLVFGLAPIVVAGPASFADEMLATAGGTNVVAEGGPYPTLGMERVFALDPEMIVDASMQESRGSERITPDTPGWGGLRAVKAGRVVTLRDEAVLRPGPRVGEGTLALAQAIHPELSIP